MGLRDVAQRDVRVVVTQLARDDAAARSDGRQQPASTTVQPGCTSAAATIMAWSFG